jgi:hypothetical protein
MQKMSMAMQKKQQLIEWRRSKVLEHHSQGYSMTEITNMLHVKNVSTISRDLEYLREKAQENLKNHIQQKLPEEFQRCITGMNQVLKLSWQIANNNNAEQNSHDQNNNSDTVTTGDDRTRLQALALINDCYKYIMDLTTNGVIITDAIKFVQTNKEKLTTMSGKKEEKGKETEESDYDDEVETYLFCGRKSIYPEKDFGDWFYPREQTCFDFLCFSK